MLEEMLPAGTEKLQIVRSMECVGPKDFKNAVVQLAYHHEPPRRCFPGNETGTGPDTYPDT
jgi:hypothetical protein